VTFQQIVLSIIFGVVLAPMLALSVYVATHLDTGESRPGHH
jgi:hypothetical protein